MITEQVRWKIEQSQTKMLGRIQPKRLFTKEIFFPFWVLLGMNFVGLCFHETLTYLGLWCKWKTVRSEKTNQVQPGFNEITQWMTLDTLLSN